MKNIFKKFLNIARGRHVNYGLKKDLTKFIKIDKLIKLKNGNAIVIDNYGISYGICNRVRKASDIKKGDEVIIHYVLSDKDFRKYAIVRVDKNI